MVIFKLRQKMFDQTKNISLKTQEFCLFLKIENDATVQIVRRSKLLKCNGYT